MDLPETPTACITHASTALSRQFANYFAAKGYALLLTGLDRNALKSLAEAIRWEYQVSVNIAILDLTNRKNVESFINHWIHDSTVEVCINNTKGLFEESLLTIDNQHEHYLLELIHSNIEILSRAISEEFSRKERGSLVSIASIGQKRSSSRTPEHNQDFLVALHKELQGQFSRQNITFQVLCPYTEENIQKKASQEKWEEYIVRESIKGLIQRMAIVKTACSSPLATLFSQLNPLKRKRVARRRKLTSFSML